LWAFAWVLWTLGAQWLSGMTGGWQFVRDAYRAGARWQLLTSQWVHFGFAHAAVNALALVVMLLAFQALVPGRRQALALLGGYAGVALVLAMDPACATYAGASGALHGMLAGNAVSLLSARQSQAEAGTRSRVLGVALLFGLSVKLLVQQWVGDPSAAGWLGFPTYHPAHAAGSLGGLLAVVLAQAVAGRRAAGPVGGQ
jgi:rhomboid family GlyGly-CTERM serine protease